MFKHRLTRFCVSSLFAMCVLFVGGSLQSCKDWLDVYPYDDPGDPEWLGASVYDFLKKGTAKHSYTNYVALIDSLRETETLAHTGSKTLFIADDEAFEKFFQKNPWNVKSVAEMSKAQMKTILFGSMLDNAMLLDMFSSSGVDTNQEGTCLRRNSSLQVIDDIPNMPNAETAEQHKDWPTYNRYWDAVRGKQRDKQMRLAMDGTRPMLVHFIGDYLRKNNIKAEDISFLFKKNGEQQKTFVNGEAFVFGNKILSSDVNTGSYSDDTLTIACKNGYLYRMDDVLLPPSNMAAELRKRPDTRVVSHLLDRFCVPEYDSELSSKFNAYHNTADSVFRLRYLTSSYKNHPLFKHQPPTEELLVFDPGQNTLNIDATGVMAKDMAAMFVPNDKALYEHFTAVGGTGRFLLSHYAPSVKLPEDEQDIDLLMSALDSIPEKNIVKYLNNWMKKSFAKTVLSKFDKITDDASELMDIREEHVDECVIANNGVIYITNRVFPPTSYESVIGPTLVNDNMDIMRTIVYQLHYEYYLLAMDADYSFIVPDDKHFFYYDPLTLTSDAPKAYAFQYDSILKEGKKELKFSAKVYDFHPKTYELDTKKKPTEATYKVDGKEFDGINGFAATRFTDIMEYLIIVHNDGLGIRADKKYYQTKGYGTIKVDATDPNNVKFYGGEQLERGTYVVAKGQESITKQENGTVYCTLPGELSDTSAIPTPPTKSVYDNLNLHATASEYDRFFEFYNLCYPGENYGKNDDKDILKKVFGTSVSKDNQKKYSIFYTNISDEKEFTKNTVPFFNIFHYTVYAPSNESIREMYELGLPTWAKVDSVAAAGKKEKALKMLMSIINFAKYHFQDNSIYVDNSPITSIDPQTGEPVPGKTFTTALMNEKTSSFYKLEVKRNGDREFTVTDERGNTRNVVTTGDENKDYNIMCRDNIYFASKAAGEEKITESATLDRYSSTSYSVLQPIDGALLNDAMFGYDGRFKRFADNGLTVDIMYVDGTGAINVLGDEITANADVTVEADNGGLNYYLVADAGTVEVDDVDGTKSKHKAGYLMKVIDNPDPVTREKLVVQENQNILITDEGYAIKLNGTSYEYVYKDGNKVKYNNDGTVRDEKTGTGEEVEEPEVGEEGEEPGTGEEGENN